MEVAWWPELVFNWIQPRDEAALLPNLQFMEVQKSLGCSNCFMVVDGLDDAAGAQIGLFVVHHRVDAIFRHSKLQLLARVRQNNAAPEAGHAAAILRTAHPVQHRYRIFG
jgi:hypothetical protein